MQYSSWSVLFLFAFLKTFAICCCSSQTKAEAEAVTCFFYVLSMFLLLFLDFYFLVSLFFTRYYFNLYTYSKKSLNTGAKVKECYFKVNFDPLCFGKKTFYAKSAQHLLVPDFVLIEFCQFFRLLAHIPYKILKYIFLFTESICICTEGKRKYTFLISSILTETMHTNSN